MKCSIFRFCLTIGLLCLTQISFAADFTCKMQLYKAVCWHKYEAQLQMIDAMTLAKLDVYVIPKGKDFVEVTFDCKKLQAFHFSAKHEPAVWENRKGEVYRSRKVWQIPLQLEEGQTTWVAQVCFSTDFLAVPLPLTDINRCECEFQKINPTIPDNADQKKVDKK